jgi:hypothetical protein
MTFPSFFHPASPKFQALVAGNLVFWGLLSRFGRSAVVDAKGIAINALNYDWSDVESATLVKRVLQLEFRLAGHLDIPAHIATDGAFREHIAQWLPSNHPINSALAARSI